MIAAILGNPTRFLCPFAMIFVWHMKYLLHSPDYRKPKPQFPQVRMTEQNIFLESTGLEVVLHILVRRRSGCGISWLLARFLVPLQALFSKTKDCDTMWYQYQVSTRPSWQVQPWRHCSASLLESWELLRRNLVIAFLSLSGMYLRESSDIFWSLL